MINKLKPLLRWLSFLAVPLIFIGLSYLVDWHLAVKTFRDTNLFLVALAISLSLLYPVIGAARWRAIVEAFNKKMSFRKSLQAIMIAFSANLFVPAKTGDFLKALVSDVHVDKKKLASGVIAERTGDISALGFLASAGGILISNYWVFYLGIALNFGIILVIFLGNKYLHLLRKIKLSGLIEVLADSVLLWRTHTKKLLKAFCWSLFNWIIGGIQVWLFFLSLGSKIPLQVVLAGFPATVLISILPLTPGGVGVRESAYAFVFQSYSDAHVSIGVSLAYYCFSTGLLALLGSLFVYAYLDRNIVKKRASSSLDL